MVFKKWPVTLGNIDEESEKLTKIPGRIARWNAVSSTFSKPYEYVFFNQQKHETGTYTKIDGYPLSYPLIKKPDEAVRSASDLIVFVNGGQRAVMNLGYCF